MLRELQLTVGPFHVVVSAYGVAMLAAVAAGAQLALRRARDPDVVRVALVVAIPCALLGAAGLHRLVHGGGAFGGFSSTGGIVGLVVAGGLVARAARCPAADVLDALAPAGLLALAVGRLGCFLAGCCYGRATTLPWGVVFPELGPPARHPLQLYEALADVALLLRLPPPDAPRGSIARAAAVGYGGLRAALETLRAPAAADLLAGGRLTLAQVAMLCLAGAAWRTGRKSLAPPQCIDYGSAAKESPAWPMRRR